MGLVGGWHGAPELRALYVQVCYCAALHLEGLQGLAAHGQPPHHAAFEMKLWEAGMRDGGFSLHTSQSSQQRIQSLQALQCMLALHPACPSIPPHRVEAVM